MQKPANLAVAISALAGITLALVVPASAAKPTCPPKFVSPSDGATISLTPSIKFEPTGRNCNPNWKVIEVYVIDSDTKQVIYSRENDRGASRGYSPKMLPFKHTVPQGHLRRGDRYSINIAVTIPKVFRPNWATERESVTVSTRSRTSGEQDNSVSWEPGTDRPGSDYRNFKLAQDQPGLCARQCEQERRCESYTYVKPGVQGAQARCWLKDAVPQPVSDDCCVSGVK